MTSSSGRRLTADDIKKIVDRDPQKPRKFEIRQGDPSRAFCRFCG
jgi:hypothetical protein